MVNTLAKEKKDEAKKKADDILAKVKAGEDLKLLQRKYSEDPGDKRITGRKNIQILKGTI